MTRIDVYGVIDNCDRILNKHIHSSLDSKILDFFSDSVGFDLKRIPNWNYL